MLWMFSTAPHRGSDWAALALGSRLALGVAASILLELAKPAGFDARVCFF
jgi:hypothetical protein